MLAPWKKSYEQPRQHITKQRHHYANKGPSSQSYGFSNSHVWMRELDHEESWVPNNWCFWTVVGVFSNCCWRRLLRFPWTARRSNQSIVKEINSEYSLEGLVLKLKLQHFGHQMRTADSLKKTLMLGKIEEGDDRGWDGWMASLTQWIWVWAGSRRWWRMGRPYVLQPMGWQRVRQGWAERLNNSIGFSAQDGGMEDAKICPMSPPCGHLLNFTFWKLFQGPRPRLIPVRITRFKSLDLIIHTWVSPFSKSLSQFK